MSSGQLVLDGVKILTVFYAYVLTCMLGVYGLQCLYRVLVGEWYVMRTTTGRDTLYYRRVFTVDRWDTEIVLVLRCNCLIFKGFYDLLIFYLILLIGFGLMVSVGEVDRH